jgi:AraC-like DNA-binding protein
MRRQPLISIAATVGLLEAIEAGGGDSAAVLDAVGLDEQILSVKDARIPALLFARMLEESARTTGDDSFGLHFAERYNPKNVGPLAYIVLNSPTIGAAFENGARYWRIHNEAARASLVIERDRACLRYSPDEFLSQSWRQHTEYALAVALSAMRLMVGSDWSPREVYFVHRAGAMTPEHTRIFRAPVLFGCEANAFITERDFLERQVPAADARLCSILQSYLDLTLADLPREDEFLGNVRRAIADAIREGHANLSRVAKRLAMSPRSLQRRIGESGADFMQLLDDTRRRIAIKHLKEDKDSLTEIAFMLGYSDLSAFSRAFKRWTGTAPLDYRRHFPDK